MEKRNLSSREEGGRKMKSLSKIVNEEWERKKRWKLIRNEENFSLFVTKSVFVANTFFFFLLPTFLSFHNLSERERKILHSLLT